MTRVTQPVRLGIDPGRTNIGLAAVREDGTCLFRAKVETRNKEIPKLMEERREHRQQSRRGERLARKRLAKKNRTTMEKPLERSLPGYGKGHVVVVKDIRMSSGLLPLRGPLLMTNIRRHGSITVSDRKDG